MYSNLFNIFDVKSLILKRFIFLLFPFFLACDHFMGPKDLSFNINDSIQFYAQQANDFSLDEDERKLYIEKALRLTAGQPMDSLNFINYYYIAFSYANANDYDNYKKILNQTLTFAKIENDTVNLARAYSYLGDYYSETSQSDSAYYYFYQAEKAYFKLKNNASIGSMFLKKANAQFKERDYIGSEKSAYTALNYLRLENQKNLIFDAYNVLGLNSLDLKDYDRALEHFNKTLDIANEGPLRGYFQSRALALNNLGVVYQKKGQFNDALVYFELAFQEENLKEEFPMLYASIQDNIAFTNLKLGNIKDVKENFMEALDVRIAHNSIPAIVTSKLHLSEYFLDTGNTDAAIEYARQAHEMATNSRILNLQLRTVEQLGKVEIENQTFYSKEYIKLSDSLMAAERKISEKFARIEYETEEIRRQKEQLAIQNRNIIFFGTFTFFIIVLLYIIRDQRNRNVRLKLREAQQRANEEIYNLMLTQQSKMDEVVVNEKKRIAQELHDGVLGRLFGARLNLDTLNKLDDPNAARQRTHYIHELKNIEQDIREISHDLNRETTALINNFLAILTNLFEEQQNINSAVLEYKLDPKIKWEQLRNSLKINLYRIIQESLHNINKYAQATEIRVILIKEDNEIKLTIVDNGTGFDVKRKSKGIGLQNMIARVTACQGSFHIDSQKGKGTSICVRMPFVEGNASS